MKYQDQTYAITTIIRIQTCKINVIYGKNEHHAIKKNLEWQSPPIVGIGDSLHTLEWMSLNGADTKDSLLLKGKAYCFPR